MKVHIFVFFIVLQSITGEQKTINIDVLLNEPAKQYFEDAQLNAVTSECNSSLNKIWSAPNINTFKFYDASTKLPTGLLDGTYFDLGNYQECMNIHDVFDGEEIYGKYCLGTIPFDMSTLETYDQKKLRNLGSNNMGLHWAYCLPHTCTIEDFGQSRPWITFKDQYCYTYGEPQNFDAVDITTIVVLSIFLTLVVGSTVIDLAGQYFNTKPSHDLLLAFSIWTNGKKILKTTNNSDQLTCLNGIRAISMAWVIYGHETSGTLGNAGAVNMMVASDFVTKFKNMYLVAAPVAVDTFFAMSGLLVMYLYMKNADKGEKFTMRKIPMFYLHRYLRLTPPVAILILFNASLFRYIGSGPFWGNAQPIVTPCREYWWSTLLYIQNNVGDMCGGHTWYLAVDMQLFILTPIILILMTKSQKIGILSLSGLIVTGFVVPFTVTYVMDLNASMYGRNMGDLGTYSKYYYHQTYARFGPYVIGMLFGWIIHKLKKNPEIIDLKVKNKQLTIILLWIISISGLFASTYGGYEVLSSQVTDTVSKSFWNGFHRNTWAISVAIAVTLCTLGMGGPINSFLSLPIFQFLSKLSYSMYLVHFNWVLNGRMMSIKVLMYFSDATVLHNFMGDFMATLMISFVYCAVFESPILIIEKVLFRGQKSNKIQRKEAPTV